MRNSGQGPKVREIVLMLIVAAALVGAPWAPWALSTAVGQTIPLPTDTPTPKPTAIPIPTNTWTPRPTWTRVPTMPPEQATATPTPPAATATPQGGRPTLVETPGQRRPTPTMSPTGRLPTVTAVPEPGALLLEVVTEPQAAGPMDEVRFTVQVANVGRGPASGVAVEALLPPELLLQAVNCDRCGTVQSGDRLTLDIGRLSSGEQVLAFVTAEVSGDAWPGQTVQTEWKVSADDATSQTVRASIELPWAELPATGQADYAPHCLTRPEPRRPWQGLLR